MFNTNQFFTYKGFEPNQNSKDYLYSEMTELLQEAPPSSNLRIGFRKTKDFVKGILSLQTPEGQIFSSAVADSFENVIDSLKNAVSKKIDHLTAEKTVKNNKYKMFNRNLKHEKEPAA